MFRSNKCIGWSLFIHVKEKSLIKFHLVHTSTIYYTYDADGTLISMNYNGNEYFYITNMQGDVVELDDISGNTVVKYKYDAWGAIIYQYDSGLGIANANPFRYRSYYFDSETGWYYLQSRYYNPTLGRFISSDGSLGKTQSVASLNTFAYCENNPIMRVDSIGYSWRGFWEGMYLVVATTIGAVGGFYKAGPWGAVIGSLSAYAVADNTKGAIGDAADAVGEFFVDTVYYNGLVPAGEWIAQAATDAWNWTRQAAVDTWNWTKQAANDVWDWVNGDNWYQTLVRDTIIGVIVLVVTTNPITWAAVCITAVGIGIAFVFDQYIWE